MTNYTTSENFLGVMQFGNQVTDGWLGPMIVFCVFVFVFIGSRMKHDSKLSLAMAGGFTAIVSIVFYTLKLIGGNTLAYFLIGGALSVLLVIFTGEE